MNDLRVYKSVHFSDDWAKQITEAHHKENNTTNDTYMYYHDYDTAWGDSHHYVCVTFSLDDNYLFKGAVKFIVNEAIQFFKQNKENHNI